MAQDIRISSKTEKQPIGDIWATLKIAWKSYKLARMNSDKAGMIEHAKRIRSLQEELGAKKSQFPELKD